jgi:uncharacterized protein CbrC (UPF0167 family)
VVCGATRGYIYTSNAYSEEEYYQCICPWCIADGTAYEKLGVEFTDAHGVGGGGKWDSVPASVMESVIFRTPGFSGWQQEKWFTHCGDAAAFLGRVGYAELLEYGEKAINAILADSGLQGDEGTKFVMGLSKNGSRSAYLFQCLHCGQYGGYTDCD